MDGRPCTVTPMTPRDPFTTLETNMADWASELLLKGATVPVTVLGTRAGAVVTSAVAAGSGVGGGALDEAVRAAAAWTLARGADGLVVALVTSDPAWGVTTRSLVVASAVRASAAAVVVSPGGLEVKPFERVSVSSLVRELEREPVVRAGVRVKAAGVEVLDLEERLGVR